MPDADDDTTGDEWGMVMPFVVTRSVGGEFEDCAYMAGYQCGLLDAELSTCAATPQGIPALPGGRWLVKGVLAQVDLIAMRHGYTTTAGEEHDAAPGWVWVEFGHRHEPAGPPAPGGGT